jgi:2-polyprenyl-3-methyl-5-hydroxy-6-metoxy-1,4-benzoquinol methylase
VKDEQGVKNFFSGYAKDFDSIYGDGKPRNLFNRIMDKLFRQAMYERYKRTISFLISNDINTVLDVGCGSGRYAIDLSKAGMRITGVDLAQEMLDIAESMSNNLGYKNEFILGSYLDVDIDSKKDAAILMGFFDYISNPLDIFFKLKNDTNKFILASFPKSGGILAFQRKIRYNLRNCQLFYYDENIIKKIMVDSGIEDFEIQENDREFFLIARLT